MDLHHETIELTQSFPVSRTRLFKALTSTKEREIWGRPDGDTEIRILESDVRTGGSETGLCGPRGEMRWQTKVFYHLVEVDRMILFTEELWEDKTLLTVALITFDVAADGDKRSRLRLTDQVTSFFGADAARGHRSGYTLALKNLEALLRDTKS